MTESVLNMGIKFNLNEDGFLQIVEKNKNETSSKYLILTSSSRIFTIIIFNKINM
jgi:hypothetical protein